MGAWFAVSGVTIGRCELGYPYDVTHDGDRLSFTVDIDADAAESVAVAKVVRQQLLGYVNNADEPVIPVTFGDDDDWDGFYRVARISVEPEVVFLANGFSRCRVDLERVGGYQQPLFELTCVTGTRDTSHSAVTPAYLIGLPDAAIRDSSSQTRPSASGDVRLDSAATDVVPFTIEPSDAYIGGCKVEHLVAGSWYPLVGSQSVGTVSAIRLSNDVVRLSFVGASLDTLRLEVYDGSVWDAVGDFNIDGPSASGNWSAVGLPRIMRNSPESCSIQVTYNPATSPTDRNETAVFTVRRAMRFVTCHMQADLQIGTGFSVSASSSTAATAITGGIRQTSNGATGHRWLLASDADFGTDLVNGGISSPTSPKPDSFLFALGAELDGSSSVIGGSAAAVVAQYWGIVSASQRVVSR